MHRGTIKTISEKGFGFITRGKGEKDLFFHSSNLHGVHFNDLHVGDEMVFDVESGPKGPFATNIEKAQN